MLGALFARQGQAAGLAARLTAGLARVRAAARGRARERVLYLIWRKPWMGVSADTYIARTLALIGWETVPGGGPGRYPRVDPGQAAGAGLERVLLSSEPFPFTARHIPEVRALVGAGPRIELIDAEMVSWYGSRAIAGLEHLAKLAASAAQPRESSGAGRAIP